MDNLHGRLEVSQGRRIASDDALVRWRDLSSVLVLRALSDYCKVDPAFRPTKDPYTQRWHARAGVQEFEFLLNGSKFFDTQSRKGGGGAIDLAMHLLRTDFRGAIAALSKTSL